MEPAKLAAYHKHELGKAQPQLICFIIVIFVVWCSCILNIRLLGCFLLNHIWWFILRMHPWNSFNLIIHLHVIIFFFWPGSYSLSPWVLNLFAIGLWNMLYLDVICVIWHQMTHMTSNDAYDIQIWHKSILPILVSKEASEPQLSNLWFQFGLRNCFKMK